VGLPELAARLDETSHWALQLSPGEQQRIAFARALVQKPDWLFLDEATSAVDDPTEARLYCLVRDRLPDTTFFSVGHRSTLRPFHARQLVVQLDGDGPGSIVGMPVSYHHDCNLEEHRLTVRDCWRSLGRIETANLEQVNKGQKG
jgi:putative ATP-binding cassette transporter